MKSRIRHSSPLRLSRETLRVLGNTELSIAVGGSYQVTVLEETINDCVDFNTGGEASHTDSRCTGVIGNTVVILPPLRNRLLGG